MTSCPLRRQRFFSGGDLSRYDDLLAVQLACQLDDGFRGAMADKSRISPAPQSKANGFYDDGFAASRFTGYDVEAVLKIDIGLLDDGKIADADVVDHCPLALMISMSLKIARISSTIFFLVHDEKNGVVAGY